MRYSRVAGLLLCWAAAFTTTYAESCAASPEAAARNLIGTEPGGIISPASQGFRAHDLLIDPILKRVWVRVMNCADVDRPMVLVAVGGSELPGSLHHRETRAALSPAPVPVSTLRIIAVHGGEQVQLAMRSESLRMNLQAVAEGSGAIGETLMVALPSPSGSTEPSRHMRVRVTAPGQVEVMP